MDMIDEQEQVRMTTELRSLELMTPPKHRPRRGWGWNSNTSKKGRQNAALRFIENLESPIANAHPVHDADWIGVHAGRIKRTRAWQAIQDGQTGDALYADWDDYCYFRWGRGGQWFNKLIREHDETVKQNTAWHLASKPLNMVPVESGVTS